MAEERGRTFLVAVDEGDESSYALSWCLKNVVCDRNPKDTIVLLYAKPARVVYAAMDATGYMFAPDFITTMDGYGNEVARSVMDTAKQVCNSLNDQVKVETMVEHGDPRDVICEVADKLKVDCLIIGSHGYGAIKGELLGSVSNHCAQNVKCPVLIVKKPKPDGAHHHH
ncbi:Adenine nucleotide alpha hydrolases-like superfamily protein isoform 2 [Dorcoceras hygrometricum]|uniref:Adenine nucleotide alpha hydrolases-like superfamily protein isoform 2 n=1 Tax=Dorcoceras hygrometricum TaxID=472368 RepID=A0A2Z7DB71_9LAMI|nr:Adenine nucleotide alpha hydrolases-like superfamily protein isoform 2 [Dorcoceras hygrometricum]